MIAVFKAAVAKLMRYAAKGADGESVRDAMFIEGLGMGGDFHAQGGQRQVSFLSLEDVRWMQSKAEPGLCFGRYKANILLDTDVPPDEQYAPATMPETFVPGQRVTIGDAIFEITDTGKKCFEVCPLFSREFTCPLAGRNLFASVVQSGIVCLGDDAVAVML